VWLRASGQPFAVSVVHKGDDAMLVVPTRAESWDATWLDAVAAQLLGVVPIEVISAVRLAPRGRQEGLSAVRYPGGLLDPDHDPIIELVHLRAQAKAKGDLRLAAQLRIMCNGMVYGNFARFDSIGTGSERPGPWCFPPMAAVMAAGSRCLLAMVEARVRNIGGVVAQRDTDGVLIVAAPEGGF